MAKKFFLLAILALAALKRETVNDLTLLYTWPATDPGLKPALFMAHMDMVQVAAATRWQQQVTDFFVRFGGIQNPVPASTYFDAKLFLDTVKA